MSNGGYFHLIIIVMNIKSKIFNLVFWSAVLMIFYLVLQWVFSRNVETRVERYILQVVELSNHL
jgi:uncharacterized protein YggT (Ycf19 family)